MIAKLKLKIVTRGMRSWNTIDTQVFQASAQRTCL